MTAHPNAPAPTSDPAGRSELAPSSGISRLRATAARSLGGRVAGLEFGRWPGTITVLVVATWLALLGIAAAVLLVPAEPAVVTAGDWVLPWIVGLLGLAATFAGIIVVAERPQRALSLLGVPFIALMLLAAYVELVMIAALALALGIGALHRDRSAGAGARMLGASSAAVLPLVLLVDGLLTPGSLADYPAVTAAITAGIVATIAAAVSAIPGTVRARMARVSRWGRFEGDEPASHLEAGSEATMTERSATERRQLRLVPAVALAVVAVGGLRMTVAQGMFGQFDALLWSGGFGLPLLAAVPVGALLIALVLRAQRRGITDRATTPFVRALTLASLAWAGIFALDGVVGLLRPDEAGMLVYVLGVWSNTITALLFVATILVFLLPAFRGTVARSAAVMSALCILPASLATTLDLEWGLDSSRFWASAPEVATITPILVLGAWLVRRRDGGRLLDGRTAILLAVVPMIAVHALLGLPPLIEQPIARPLVIALALVASALIPLNGPVDQHGHAVLRRAGTQATLLTVYLLLLLSRSDLEVYSVLSLAFIVIPLATVVCLQVVAGRMREGHPLHPA